MRTLVTWNVRIFNTVAKLENLKLKMNRLNIAYLWYLYVKLDREKRIIFVKRVQND